MPQKWICNGQEVGGERFPCRRSIALLQLRNPAGWYHSYFIPGKDYLSGPWEMYWSVFLFPPAITWQRHLGGEWMSDARSVSPSAGGGASSVHRQAEREAGRHNVVINSVWTYSLCKQGGPLCPRGHRSLEDRRFWFLSCPSHLFCRVASDDGKRCKLRRFGFPLTDACSESEWLNSASDFSGDVAWSDKIDQIIHRNVMAMADGAEIPGKTFVKRPLVMRILWEVFMRTDREVEKLHRFTVMQPQRRL